VKSSNDRDTSTLKDASNVSAIYKTLTEIRLTRPLFAMRVPAGFPSPAEEYLEKRLDLNDLIRHPVSTFFVRVTGDSMTEAGIDDGDLLIVDKAEEVRNGHICVVTVNGEFCVKRFEKNGEGIRLLSANKNYAPIEIRPESDFEVWGRVLYVLKKC
jgi:DNA polymerase V